MIRRPPRSTLFPYTTLFRSPDVVHFHNFFPLLTPGALAEAAGSGLPTIQTLHNYRALCANGLFFRNGQVCQDRKSTRLNSSHANISYAVFCLKKKKITISIL